MKRSRTERRLFASKCSFCTFIDHFHNRIFRTFRPVGAEKVVDIILRNRINFVRYNFIIAFPVGLGVEFLHFYLRIVRFEISYAARVILLAYIVFKKRSPFSWQAMLKLREGTKEREEEIVRYSFFPQRIRIFRLLLHT